MTRSTRQALGGLVALAVLLVVALAVGAVRDGGTTSTSTSRSTGPTATRSTRLALPTRTAVPSPTGATRASVDPDSGLPWIEAADLPDEALDVLDAIDNGGPFDYPGKDGSTFGNFEGVLPDRQRGYYHEYTVRTPGEGDRGARRIVTGGPVDDPDAYFWTDDHYDTFARVRR